MYACVYDVHKGLDINDRPFPPERFPQGRTVRWREALLLEWIAVRVSRQECFFNIEVVGYPQCWIGPSKKNANTCTIDMGNWVFLHTKPEQNCWTRG